MESRHGISSNRIVTIVFFALLCDLLAFTIPLPLFPRLINDFVEQEALSPASSPTLLSYTLSFVRSIRSTLFSFSHLPLPTSSAQWDLTLLGGLLASLFSFCQFIVSPHIGQLSDRYGRRTILLLSMLGNIISAMLWVFSSSFSIYAVSRIVGGLSEGNVQLSVAIISDVTSPSQRAKSLALVGAAFSLAFTIGPSLGAYFASRLFRNGAAMVLPVLGQTITLELNSYALPALISLLLLMIETIGLFYLLPETKGWRTTDSDEVGVVSIIIKSEVERAERLKELEWLHLGFLFFFSGAEFTLTFLCYNLFAFTNMENGRLLGFIGFLSALLQGTYIRRRKGDSTSLLQQGLITCCLSLVLLAALPHVASISFPSTTLPFAMLMGSGTGLAFVSASVVNSLTSLASLECTPSASSISKLAPSTPRKQESGKALGRFRSRGQLGRALGPLFSTSIYFACGPGLAYTFGAIGVGGLTLYSTASHGKVKQGKVKSRQRGKLE